MKKVTGFFLIAVLMILAAMPVAAQSVSDAEAPKDTTLTPRIAPTPEPSFSALYEIKNQSPRDIAALLSSMFARVTVRTNDVFNSVIVTARAEEHKTIGEFIQKYDVPKEVDVITTVAYEIKNQKASDIAHLLIDLLRISPAAVTSHDTLNIVTIIARGEIHKAAAEYIRKYDVPKETKTVELQFFLILAGDQEDYFSGNNPITEKHKAVKEVFDAFTEHKSQNPLPENIQKVLKDVTSLMRYNDFLLIDDPYLLSVNHSGSTGTILSGSANVSEFDFKYELRTDALSISERDGKHSVESPQVSVAIDFYGQKYQMGAPLILTDGEMAVIGTSRAKTLGTGLIAIITAKIL